MTGGPAPARVRTTEERLHNSDLRQRFRVELGDAIRSLASAELIQDAACRLLLKHFDASRVHYAEIEPDGQHAVVPADHASMVPDRTGRYDLADFPALISALRAGCSFVVADLPAHPEIGAAEKARFAAMPVAAIVVAPLVKDGRLAAMLAVHRSGPYAWSLEEVALIEETAERTWVAIERARAEASLRELNETLRRNERNLDALIRSSSEVRYFLNADWSVLRQLAGGGFIPDTLGENADWLQAYIPPEGQAAVLAEIERVIRTRSTYNLEHRVNLVDGTVGWALSRAVPLFDAEGNITEWFGAASDVTARRRAEIALKELNETLERRVEERTGELMAAEEALRQSQKMEAVGQLTGGIAHDFNNMLQAIGGSLELMQRRVEQGRAAEVARFVDNARTTVGRAAALTHRLLAFARRQTLQPKLVIADQLVLGAEELLRQTAGPGITVELRMCDGTWAVLCDPNQLESVLLNLAINARDAMPAGGQLVVTTRHVRLSKVDVAGQDGAAPGDFVEIAVADTGTGMDAATRARAFEPFFTTKPIGQGTGLGLSQLYGFVRQSNGVVRIDSAPGQGTTVRLSLPRQDHAHTGNELAAPDTEPSKAGAGETVLLVEDEAGVRATAAEHLRDLGYAVLEVGNGSAALRLLRSASQVDLLVTDVGLSGGMNGRQVADAAREHRLHLPVLFITGYAGSALDGQLAPGMDVIGKPFALDALASRVRVMLDAASVT